MRRTTTLLALLLAIPIILALSFTQNPEINQGEQVFTTDQLTCEWQYSGDTTAQNITLYQDGSIHTNRYETGGSLNTSITIPSAQTTKNQEWTCEITLENATASTTQTDQITIQNTAPDTPIIYNESDENIGTIYNVTEDTTYSFDVNSTDDDGDTLIYYFKTQTQEFCEMNDEDEGLASCTPLQEDHDGTNTKVNVTFWVDDDDITFAKSASRTVTFTVTPSNDAPQAQLQSQTTPVNQTLNYDFNATDEENNTPLDFAIAQAPAEITGKLTIQSLDPDTARLTYDATTPDFNDVNESGWTITINTTDDEGASSLQNLTLNITPVGRAPTILALQPLPNASGRYELDQGENIEINITGTDEDTNDVHAYQDSTSKTGFTTTTIEENVNATGNTSGRVFFNATNDDVGDFTVTITLTDQELLTDEILLNFTVNNINDPPTIHEKSAYDSNTNQNTNTSNITAYADAPFSFRINATDPDTPYGDSIAYADNTSLFTIDDETGIISFTPQSDDVSAQPYHINITATDNESITASRTMILTINNNTAPYFNPSPIPDASCSEGTLCEYNVSEYSFDDDAGDSIQNHTITSNLSLDYNATSGLISFTPAQTQLGNHTINVTIQDERGAQNSTSFTLAINNTPDQPILTRYNFSTETIVEDKLFNYQLQAQDKDLLASLGENLTFTTNSSFATISSYTTSNNETAATLSMTPGASDVGDHTINITINDTTGLQESQVFTFEILAKTDPPVIERIRPYANESNNEPVEAYNTTAQGNSTNITFTENRTILFAHESTDDVTAQNNLETNWYYDGENVASTWNYTREFDFYSSGEHELILEINDTTLETTTYTWNLEVQNDNRVPKLLNNLTTPITINSTYVYANYLSRNNALTRFIDPDDDRNNNDIIDENETNTLSYNVIDCTSGSNTIADITISGHSITIDPENEGTCTVFFTAADQQGASKSSNNVLINVTEQPEGEEETTTTNQPSGGGGSSSSALIPIEQETETLQPFRIIAPDEITITQNQTVTIPFTVENTWNEPLELIELSAQSNETNITFDLPANLIERLEPNETVEREVIVSGYRLGSNYDIKLVASVDEPEFEDSALVTIAGLEQRSEGEDADLRVTFARDLITENAECQELNELINTAQEHIARGEVQDAREYIDAAINGCRHLMNTVEQRTERPSLLAGPISFTQATLATILYTALAIIVITTIAFIIYYHYTSKEEDDI